MNRGRRLSTAVAGAALAAGVALSASGCSGSSSATAQPPTAHLELTGNPPVESVVLTPLGAARIAVRTAPESHTAGDAVVPYAALLYEPDGAAAIYVNTGPLTYTRYLVPVARITGGQVYLKGTGGLPAGARVVTQGAEELLGVQNGVGVET